MQFGKIESVEHIDFSLPTDWSGNTSLLSQYAVNNQLPKQLYIGCTGWSMKEWVGSIYPKGAKAKDYLEHYGKQFNTIELNATHYKIPDEKTIQQWIADTPNDFKFCPKVPQTISHSKDLGLSSHTIALFCDMMLLLETRLGCAFIQLPPYFGADRLLILQQFIERVAVRIPLAIELRHESWFQNTTALSTLLDTCAAYSASMVITDVAGRRDVLHMALSSTTTMIRFVGNGLHPTDYQRIEAWIERLAQWYDSGLETVYFFPHEPDNLLAPQLADFLFKQAAPLKVKTRGPRFMDTGHQIELF